MTELATWKRKTALISAFLLGIIFLVSGGWKVISPFNAGELLEQAKVHPGFGVLGATTLGTLELFAAFLLFTPRFRKWGGLLGSAMIVFFMLWIGFYYQSLAGKECGCFPVIKRAVGPMFFVEDGVMLLLGLAALAWSPRVTTFKIPMTAFAGLALFALVSFGVNAAERSNVQVPSVVVDGKTDSLASGKVFLYFYDPECMHCDAAARFMSKLNWTDTKVVAIPTHDPQFAQAFLHDTGLKAGTSLDTTTLRGAFKFTDPPYGVALIDGRVKQTFAQMQFNEPLPEPDLKRLGFVH